MVRTVGTDGFGDYIATRDSIQLTMLVDECDQNQTLKAASHYRTDRPLELVYLKTGLAVINQQSMELQNIMLPEHMIRTLTVQLRGLPSFDMLTHSATGHGMVAIDSNHGHIMAFRDSLRVRPLTRPSIAGPFKLIPFGSGYECNGRLLIQHAVRSVDSCASICLVERSCVGFTYTQLSDVSRCLLHDVIDRNVTLTDSMSSSYCYAFKPHYLY